MEQVLSSKENPKQELIAGLRRLKTNYKDGVPNEIKHSVSDDSGWKVQRGVWFQSVALEFSKILVKQYKGENLLPKELYVELMAYWKGLTNKDHPLKQRLTTQNDIDDAETLIDKVIAELEK